MALLRKAWTLVVLVAAGGCAVYRPMPLTPEAVDARLRVPGPAELRILASEIDHPLLRPVELKPDEGLTPDSAAVLAVLLNPSLRARRDQRALTDAQLLSARLLPNPELNFSLDVPTGGDTAGRVNAYGLGLDWEVTSLLSRAARVGQAGEDREAVELDVAWQEWQVAQAAKAAVYQLVSLRSRTALGEEARRQAEENVSRIRKAVARGEMTAIALHAARTAGRLADENLLDLEKQSEEQRLKLRRLLGLPPDEPISLSRDIRLPSRVEPPDAKDLLKGLEQRRLDLMALRRGYRSQEAAVRAAVLEQFPRIVLGPTISRDTDNVRTTGFGLTLELPVFNRAQGKIARERATRRKLFDEYANRVFESRSDIGEILSGMRFLNERIAAIQALEPDLDRLVESYRAALVGGRTDARTYYAAWNDLVGLRMKVFALEGELAKAVVALQLASGLYELPGAGSPPEVPPAPSREGESP